MCSAACRRGPLLLKATRQRSRGALAPISLRKRCVFVVLKPRLLSVCEVGVGMQEGRSESVSV